MAVNSWALTTGQRVADFGELGTLEGASLTRMERIVDVTSSYIENYVGYRVMKTDYDSEEYSIEEGQILNLNNFPVDSSETFTLARRTSSLDEDRWENVDSEYYHVDYEAGIIHAAGGWEFSRTRNGFRVTYTAGYDFDNSSTFLSDTEAGDLELAAWQLCLVIYNRKGGTIGAKSERLGGYAVVYAKTIMESEDIKTILENHARKDLISVLTPLQI